MWCEFRENKNIDETKNLFDICKKFLDEKIEGIMVE